MVLALGIGAILIGVATAMRSDAKASNMRAMTRIAQSRLEAAGITGALTIGRRQGRVGQFSWRETVAPATLFRAKRQDETQPRPKGMALFWVEIAIQAADGSEEKLSALKLAGMPEQR